MIELGGATITVPNPPNMVQLDGNLFMDRTEMSNFDWREYEYWIKDVFGEGSEEHLAVLPDTTVWQTPEGEPIQPLIDQYFRHPAYDTHPVVGISHAQAEAYARWRSSRVTEVMLLEKGYLKEAPPRSPEGYFDIDFWLNGERDYKIAGAEAILVSRFELPELVQLEQARQKMHFPKGQDEPVGIQHCVLYKQYIPGCDDCANLPIQTFTQKRLFDFQHLIGNVAEMTDEPGIATGGSWAHSLEDAMIGREIAYEVPTSWLGFRCVAKWEKVRFESAR